MTNAKLTLLVALAVWSAIACSRRKGPEPARQPNVLLITVDTLRADRLGCYGFEPARTPNIDKLATQGVRVEHAIAAAPITLPSHTSILTGLEPPAHGVRDNGTYRVPDEIQTLAERLKTTGYRTQAFVSAEVLHHRYGLDQGFDGYDDQLWNEREATDFMIRERSGDGTTDRVLEWLHRRHLSKEPAEPFFVWMHLFDPHQPYDPPAADAKVAPTPYDGEIAFVDRQIGRLVGALTAQGVLDDTIVVFTSDHGESLGEHGEDSHAIFIYESTVRIPLIFRYPSKLPAGNVYAESVRSVDLMPTILALAGAAPSPTQGADLSRALASRSPAPAAPQYSESLPPDRACGMAPLHGLRFGEWTYIRAPRPELYNRAQDPGEVQNLLNPSNESASVERAKKEAAKLDGLLNDVLKQSKTFGFVAEARPLDDATADMLQALGYMGKSDASDALRGMDPKDGLQIYTQIDAALELARSGDCPTAVRALERLLAELPNLVVARNTIAKCEVRMGNPNAAKRHYVQSLAHDPQQDEVLLQLGRLALAEGDRDGARQRFRAALDLVPESVDAMMLLGYLELSGGHLEAAKRWYARAIEADPNRPDAYLFYAELYFSQRDLQEAKRWYDKALEVSPLSFSALLQAGVCALSLGDAAAAEQYFAKANQIDPSSWQPIYSLACARAFTGDSHGALTYLEKAVRAGFSDPTQLQRDECFASVSHAPRFRRLLQTLGGHVPN